MTKKHTRLIESDAHDIEWYKTHIISDLARSNTATALEIISDLGHRYAIVVDDPGDLKQVRHYINKHKQDIIRTLLWFISEFTQDVIDDFIPAVFEGFKILGVQWSEFETIADNILTPSVIRESNKSSYSARWEEFLASNIKQVTDLVNKGDVNTVISRLSILNLKLNEVPGAKSLIDNARSKLLNKLVEKVTSSDMYAVGLARNYAYTLQSIGINWGELEEIIEEATERFDIEYPPEVDDLDDIPDDINESTSLEQDIQRVLTDFAKDGRTGAYSMNFHDIKFGDDPRIDAAVYKSIPIVLNTLIKYIDKNDYSEVVFYIKELRKAKIDLPEFKYLEELIPEPIKVIMNNLSTVIRESVFQFKPNRTKEEIVRDKFDYNLKDGIYAMRGYGFTLKDFPEYAKLIEDNKVALVKGMIDDIETSNVAHMAKFLATDLITIGVTWPELQSIIDMVDEKSSDIWESSLNESKRYTSTNNVINHMINQPNVAVWFVVDAMDRYKLTLRTNPELAEYFDDRKFEMLHMLVDYAQSGYQAEMDQVEWFINALHRIGVKWPELDTIRSEVS